MAVDVSKLVITEVAQITAFNNAGELEFTQLPLSVLMNCLTALAKTSLALTCP